MAQIPSHTPVSFDTTSYRERVTCRVCGRTLLMGERSMGYFTQVGEGPFDVCELCVPRAHRFGLRPHPSTADEIAAARDGGALRQMLSAATSLLSGRSKTKTKPRRTAATPVVHGSAAVAAAEAAGSGNTRKSRRRRAAAAAAVSMDPTSLTAVPVGSAAIPVAIAAFNQSPHARTLAGLHKTLGAPRASVAPRSGTDREVILTVAWEIVWYQFRVMPDGIEQQRGTYLSELHQRWQSWNCVVAPDGRISEAGAGSGDSGQDLFQTDSPEGPSR
ncbi:MAG: hypothetical protein JWM90_1601 [Thermoleophilia bacterium]|nr:hypothetical protein [Thermoleophilia bacterium]